MYPKLQQLLAHSQAGNAQPACGLGLIAFGQFDRLAEKLLLGGEEQLRMSILRLAALGGVEQLANIVMQGLVSHFWPSSGERRANMSLINGITLGQQ